MTVDGKPPDPIQDVRILDSVKELRVMADVTRLEIMRLLSRTAMTGTMIAREIGIPANRAHYHLQRLLSVGLVQQVRTGRKRWRDERYFVSVARHFVVDPQLGCRDAGTTATLRRAIETAFMDWRRAEVLSLDWTPLVRRLVRESLQVRPGEHVLVAHGPFVLELAEAILVEIDTVGAIGHAKPWSRNVLVRTLDSHSPAELDQLRFVPESIDRELGAVILVTSSLVQGTPPTTAQREKLPHFLEMLSRWDRSVKERGIRNMEVALPHRGEFAEGELTAEEAIDTFWRCVEGDPGLHCARGRQLQDRMQGRPEIRVSCPEGTDLRFQSEPALTRVHDGVISTEDVRDGHTSDRLPSGLLSVVPREGSAEGVLIADYTHSMGRHFRDIRVELEEGRIVSIRSREDEDTLRQLIDRESGDPEVLGHITIGLNPGGRASTGKPSLDACHEGVVNASFGDDERAGGIGRSTLKLNLPSRKMSLRAGSETLVDGGALVLDGAG